MEEWKDIADYEGWYQVSNLGRVRSVSRVVPHITKGGVVSEQRWASRILRPTKTNSGYYVVVLSKKGKFSYPTGENLKHAYDNGLRSRTRKKTRVYWDE